jgi:hypothetical protein
MPEAEIIPITKKKRQPKAEGQPLQAELQSLFGKLKLPLARLLFLADRSFVDHRLQAGDVTGPDADLIQDCCRLFSLQVAINTAYEEISDERVRNAVLNPIHDQWHKVRARILKLDGPKTLEGAQGLALILLDQYPQGLDDVVAELDQRRWLAIHCARFLLAMSAPEVPTPVIENTGGEIA